MNRTRTLIVCACVLALAACKQYEEGRRGRTSKQPLGGPEGILRAPNPNATVAIPPGTTPPQCPNGYTANTYPAWCIRLPKGFSASREYADGKDMGHVDYSSSPSETLTVFFTNAPTSQVVEQGRELMSAQDFGVTREGDLDGGRHWIEGRSLTGDGHFVAVAPGHPPFAIKCETSERYGSDAFKRNADACKSLFVP